MKDYTEIIDVALLEFKNDPELSLLAEKYMAERKTAMRDRELQLRKRGLSDNNIIQDIILSENLNAKDDFLAKLHRDEKSKAEKRALIAKFFLAVIYFMVVGIVYFLDSFLNNDWPHSWLIIVAGILFFAIMLFLMPSRFHYKGRRALPLNYVIMVSTLLVAFFVWLVFEIVFKMEYSAIIITVALSIITFFDAWVPWFYTSKTAIFHTLICTPLFGALLYVTLGLAHIVPWAIGWLIIIAAIGVTIGAFLIAYNKKYKVSRHVRDVREFDYFDEEANS